MDIVYIFLILLIPSFLHKCKHAKTVRHNYSYAKRQNNQSTWVLGISHMGLRYNVLEFNWGLHRNLHCKYMIYILYIHYIISWWPLNRFGWVKAWIVGMNRIWLSFDSFEWNCTLHEELCWIYTKYIMSQCPMNRFERIHGVVLGISQM